MFAGTDRGEGHSPGLGGKPKGWGREGLSSFPGNTLQRPNHCHPSGFPPSHLLEEAPYLQSGLHFTVCQTPVLSLSRFLAGQRLKPGKAVGRKRPWIWPVSSPASLVFTLLPRLLRFFLTSCLPQGLCSCFSPGFGTSVCSSSPFIPTSHANLCSFGLT